MMSPEKLEAALKTAIEMEKTYQQSVQNTQTDDEEPESVPNRLFVEMELG